MLHLLRQVTTTQEAINYLAGTGRYANRDRFPLPGLVATDFEGDGLDLVRWMRGHVEFSAIPTIVLVEVDFEPDIQEAYAAGANDVIEKVCAESWISQLETVLAGKR